MREMKSHWMRTLRNSVFGFLCTSFLAAPWAAAQQQAAPLPALDEGLLTVLGIEKEQLDTTGLTPDDAKKMNLVRADIQEGVQAFTNRDAAKALSELEAAYKSDESLPPPSVMMARLCFASNDQNIVNLGRGFLERAVNFHRKSSEPYLLLARLALSEGRLTDAELNFNKALENAPPAADPATTPATSWKAKRHNTFLKEVYAGLVSVSEQRQQWDEADNQLISWIALDPKDAMAHFRKGRVLFMKEAALGEGKNKNFKPAEDAFVEAYKLAQEDPNRKADEVTAVPPPALAMLQLYAGSGEKDKAQDQVKSLTDEFAKSSDKKEQARVYSALSQWHLQQNDAERAGELAVMARAADEKSPALKQLSAVMHYYANNPAALKEFEEMNQEAPDDFVASNYLALLLADSPEAEKQNKAVRLAELNVRLNPKSPEAVSTLGWVYYKANRLPDAMQVYGALLQAVQQGQGQISADTAYYMAKVIFESPNVQGRLDAVVNLLRNAKDSQGPFKHREQARAWFNTLSGNTTGAPQTIDLKSSSTTGGTTPPVINSGTGSGTTTPPKTPATTTGADN
jgi:lipopolysaccharide biosynthesis regulator YciM